jgi:hypothetical protein
MTSTRNRNTAGDYFIEQGLNRQFLDYNTYQGHIINRETYLPGLGLKPARLPMQLQCDLWDIESELRGIGSTNLVEPKTTTLLPPRPSGMKSLNIHDSAPVVIPKPLKIPANARYT